MYLINIEMNSDIVLRVACIEVSPPARLMWSCSRLIRGHRVLLRLPGFPVADGWAAAIRVCLDRVMFVMSLSMAVLPVLALSCGLSSRRRLPLSPRMPTKQTVCLLVPGRVAADQAGCLLLPSPSPPPPALRTRPPRSSATPATPPPPTSHVQRGHSKGNTLQTYAHAHQASKHIHRPPGRQQKATHAGTTKPDAPKRSRLSPPSPRLASPCSARPALPCSALPSLASPNVPSPRQTYLAASPPSTRPPQLLPAVRLPPPPITALATVAARPRHSPPALVTRRQPSSLAASFETLNPTSPILDRAGNSSAAGIELGSTRPAPPPPPQLPPQHRQ